MRGRNNEFFNRDEMTNEINHRLEQLYTEVEIEKEVRRVWSLNPKAANRKRITPAERVAIQQIKQDNRLDLRLSLCKSMSTTKYSQ